jgi:hypothetical protein
MRAILSAEGTMRHDAPMDPTRVALLRELLSSTGWVDRTREFARSLQASTRSEQGLLLVGTPGQEPWHMAAHLGDESTLSGLPGLAPTLVRYSPPPGAPAHLAIGMDRLERARRGETLLVVAPDAPPAALLERVDDARRVGATVLAMDTGDSELADLAHDQLVVPTTSLVTPGWVPPTSLPDLGALTTDLTAPDVSFDVVEHLVTTAAGELSGASSLSSGRGFRDRLGRLLDTISGPSVPRDM